MKELKGENFDAISIEYAFAFFLGKEIGDRGGLHDADVFRNGEYKDYGQLLVKMAQHLEKRVARLSFAESAIQPGGAKARLDGAIKDLKEVGEILKKQKGGEQYDYHWIIVGSLVSVIDSLLKQLKV